MRTMAKMMPASSAIFMTPRKSASTPISPIAMPAAVSAKSSAAAPMAVIFTKRTGSNNTDASSGRGIVAHAQHRRQETLDGPLKLVVVRARHAPDRLQRLGKRGSRIEAQHHSLVGAQQDAVVACHGALVRGVEVLVDPGVDVNPHRRAPTAGGGALGKLQYQRERLAVAVGVPAQIANVGNAREDERRDQQCRPDVVEQAVFSRDRVSRGGSGGRGTDLAGAPELTGHGDSRTDEPGYDSDHLRARHGSAPSLAEKAEPRHALQAPVARRRGACRCCSPVPTPRQAPNRRHRSTSVPTARSAPIWSSTAAWAWTASPPSPTPPWWGSSTSRPASLWESDRVISFELGGQVFAVPIASSGGTRS